ncbi:hypothetical protein [Paraburkholderia hiiakae]|uniref:hypothetical protein n=1 Tax=Paraburkholderia hiiakae TaxID=1081782 RepID=UPI00191B479E|nr:hypothetical protein [Paraburkholderia hiiakae]
MQDVLHHNEERFARQIRDCTILVPMSRQAGGSTKAPRTIFDCKCVSRKGFAPRWRMHGTEAALYVAIDSQPASRGQQDRPGKEAAGEDQQDWDGGSVRRNR